MTTLVNELEFKMELSELIRNQLSFRNKYITDPLTVEIFNFLITKGIIGYDKADYLPKATREAIQRL